MTKNIKNKKQIMQEAGREPMILGLKDYRATHYSTESGAKAR